MDEMQIVNIEEGRLYSDLLSAGNSRTYSIEVSSDNTILIFLLEIVTENVSLGVVAEGAVSRMRLNIQYEPLPYIYYIEETGDIRIILTNPLLDAAVYYRFYVDLSEPVRNGNSKNLLLEESQVAFYADLKKYDTLSLDLVPSIQDQLGIKVLVPCYELTAGKGYYLLRLYAETLEKSLTITADLGGRYYIFIESAGTQGKFSLVSLITSPPWNQEMFWPSIGVLFVAIISPFFLIKIMKIRKPDRAASYTLIGYYAWFVTIGLAYSTIGSFNSGTPSYMILLHTSTLSSGLSIGIAVYAAHLDRMGKTSICPNCGREVNIKEDNFCCGLMIKRVSNIWFAFPFILSFLFFIIGCSSPLLGLLTFPTPLLWVGFGSILGGIISWLINKDIEGAKAWKFLVVGALFSLVSYPLILLLIDLSFQPYVELELPGKFTRIRITPLTLPIGLILIFILLTILFSLSIIVKIRRYSLVR